MNRPDRQPLDLDTIEARANAATEGPWEIDPLNDSIISAYNWVAEAHDADAKFIAAARTDVPALIAEVKRLRELNNAQQASDIGDWIDSTADPQPDPLDDPRPYPIESVRSGWHRIECPVCDWYSEGYESIIETAWYEHKPTHEQPDPLDENDHRDRSDWAGIRIIRHGHKHWHSESYELPTPCNIDHGQTSLEYWTCAVGPLTFADDPQPPQQTQNRPQTALQHTALADIAQAAHKLSQAICDWLDLKEDQ